jgi:hypothetical protein
MGLRLVCIGVFFWASLCLFGDENSSCDRLLAGNRKPSSKQISIFRLPDKLPAELQIKIASDEKTRQQAYQVVYRAYLQKGIVEPNPQQTRITPHQKLSTAHVIVALWNGQVIATTTVYEDGPMSLPLDSVFSRPPGTKDVELGALAIDPQYQRQATTLFFPLSQFAWRFCDTQLQADNIYSVVHPRHARFYTNVFLFEQVSDLIPHCDSAAGKPGIVVKADIQQTNARLQDRYQGLEPSRNLFDYLVRAPLVR